MTKKELIKKLNELNDRIYTLSNDLETLMSECKSIYKSFEELPTEENEIENSEVKENE